MAFIGAVKPCIPTTQRGLSRRNFSRSEGRQNRPITANGSQVGDRSLRARAKSMTTRSFMIDLDRDPGVQLRIDSFNVPAAARHEFEVVIERDLGFIKTLPGFKWHMAFEKASGP